MSVSTLRWLICVVCLAGSLPAPAADEYTEPTPPALSATATNGLLRFDWAPLPGIESYRLLEARDAGGPFTPVATFSATDQGTGGRATVAPAGPSGLFRLEATPVDTNTLLAATVLNRLAYGPTPDELERVRRMGPDAYIAEQLAPESMVEDLPHDRQFPPTAWHYVTATGTASSSTLYVYLTTPGEGYVDDLQLVAGRTAGAGNNLIRNGDFEAPLTDADWIIATNHAGSSLTTSVRHGGAASLHLVASRGGTTRASAIVQAIAPGLTSGQPYTISYWWRPSAENRAPLTLRLSGSGIVSEPGTTRDLLEGATAHINDLRAWHTLNAVHSRRQLLEVLLQFLDNHFVTQYAKSVEYLDNYHSGDVDQLYATRMEFKELQRWRKALLQPDCTFHDVLQISAESPAMILYLDTVNNRGSQGRIANENYARELLELFTFGVDNGYEQHDIEEMAKVWTGWSVRYVRPENEGNPFSILTDFRRPGASSTSTDLDDFIGTWSFVYKDYNHNTSTKHLFFEQDDSGQWTSPKHYPARFGPKYAGVPYGLTVTGLSGTNGIREGYQVLKYLADQPFTQEYVIVKLCRLLVHDEFRHGVYDYTAAELSPEAALVKSAMDAWDGTSPKGQIRVVLKTILNSEMFRRHGASQQKVRTPFEFAVGSIRAFLARNPDGTFTASTDGYSLRNLMRRAGSMDLFNRAEPDGWPERAAPWISAGTLAERLRFAQALAMPASYSAKTDITGASSVDPAALVRLKLPAERWRDSEAVVDYFLGLLYPAEGKGNLAPYRKIAVSFLDTGDDGKSASTFANLTTGGNPSPWEIRLRGMVAVLMTLPPIQEQ